MKVVWYEKVLAKKPAASIKKESNYKNFLYILVHIHKYKRFNLQDTKIYFFLPVKRKHVEIQPFQ